MVVKPHGRLVLVSSRGRPPSTSSLSTWSSSRGLQGPCGPGILIFGWAWRLDAFSAYPDRTWLPSLCAWRHNWDTSGSFVRVLSYYGQPPSRFLAPARDRDRTVSRMFTHDYSWHRLYLHPLSRGWRLIPATFPRISSVASRHRISRYRGQPTHVFPLIENRFHGDFSTLGSI